MKNNKEVKTKIGKEEDNEQFVIYSVVSSFLCKGCGSDNIKERSGYKVCFDCGKGH
tara:strand:+ start:39 stop:206 length:168 start_codon:yes stop_codon:yes gene_type:complete